MTWAVIADRYKWYGLDFSSKQARFYGMPKEVPAMQKEMLKDFALNRRRFDVFDLSDGALEMYLQVFKRNKFDYLYGYTNSLVMFARYILKKGIVLKDECRTLKLCISTSETCTVEDAAILQKAFGVPHIREYGISETCLTAFDAPDGIWRLTEETLYTEVVDDNKIISTSLYNTAMPMIRYETGDEGVIGERAKNIYRPLQKLIGRTNDTIILPGGKKAAGLTFYYISRSILEASGVLKEFIIRQIAIDTFAFDIVADRPLTNEEVKLVNEKSKEYLGAEVNVVIHPVDKINRPPSGKLKHFYSELR